MNWRVACIVWGLVAAAPAQTYIVDGANGPGTNFPDIASAIQAVPDGAVLRVRPGNYGAFFIDGNQLWALAASGAFFYALTLVAVVSSWWIIKRSLPADHPGIRHPRVPAVTPAATPGA